VPKLIYGVKADYFKALAHPARIRILELLRQGERSVGELVADLELEQSTHRIPTTRRATSQGDH
jgi:predicted transcriptional regulator